MARTGPFPGMDPWVESRWSGFHQWLTVAIGEQLNDVLPENFVAKVEERVFVGYADGGRRDVVPDVYVIEHPERPPTATAPATTGSAVSARPLIFHFGDEPVTEAYIEIVDAENDTLVITALEVLSPTNKSGPGRREYEAKRDEYHAARVSTVEIDLLRRGPHTVALPEGFVGERHASPYKVCVMRGWRVPERVAEYYPIQLSERLPRVAVPLRQGDADVTVDLQAAFERAYVNGRFDRTRYDRPPEPPLSPDDAAWAAGRVAAWRAANAAG